jgi:excisionase family DNA binding protein
MTPAEVAAELGVNPAAVRRWAESGVLPALKTPGGRRRYRASDVRSLGAVIATGISFEEHWRQVAATDRRR